MNSGLGAAFNRNLALTPFTRNFALALKNPGEALTDIVSLSNGTSALVAGSRQKRIPMVSGSGTLFSCALAITDKVTMLAPIKSRNNNPRVMPTEQFFIVDSSFKSYFPIVQGPLARNLVAPLVLVRSAGCE